MLSHQLGAGPEPRLFLVGAALVFGSAMCYAVYLVTGSQLVKRVGSMRFTAYTMMVSTVPAVVQFLLLEGAPALALPGAVWVYAVLLATVCTVLPVFLVAESLNRQGKSVRGSKVLVLGVAYKAEIDDTRESPSLDIMEELRERGAVIEYSDPYVPTLQVAGFDLKSAPITPARLQRYDCVVIATAHRQFAWDEILEHGKAIVDTRNALRGHKSEKIVRL